MGSGAQDRIRVRLLVKCTGWIGLCLELGSLLNVGVRLRRRFRFTVRYVGCRR